MKKIIGLFLFIILFIPTIVYAKDIELVSLKPVYDESSGIILNDASADSFDVTFNAANQEIKFEAVIRNTTDKDIIVNSINVTSPTYNFMSYKVEGIELNDVLKSNEDKNITLTIKSEHATDILQNFEDRIVVDVNGKYREIIPILDNPATGVFTFIVLIPVWIIGTAIILLIKKKSNKSLFKMNMVLLIIVSTITVGRISALQVFNIKINGKVDYKSDIIMANPSNYNLSTLLSQNRSNILSLEFRGNGEVPEEYDEVGDISQAQDGRVKLYLKHAVSGTGTYWHGGTYDYCYSDGYIVADGMIYFPEGSAGFFEYFSRLYKIHGMENTGTDYVKTMERMFYNIGNDDIDGERQKLDVDLDLRHWNFSNVTSMASMFAESYRNLSDTIEGHININMEGADTSNVTNMYSMFMDFASGLIFGTPPENGYPTDVTLNMNNINVENVQSFQSMFYCWMRAASHPKLELKGWTINGDVRNMFSAIGVKSPNQAYLTIEDFTINNGAVYMFNNQAGTSNPGGMIATMKNIKIVGSAENMFYDLIYNYNYDTIPNFAEKNKLIIENWDTSELTNMRYMFSNVYVKELDFSSFDTSKVTNMDSMMNSNYILETIYVSDKWSTESLESANSANNILGSNNPLYDYIRNRHGSSFTSSNYKPYMNTTCDGIFTDKNNPKNCPIASIDK